VVLVTAIDQHSPHLPPPTQSDNLPLMTIPIYCHYYVCASYNGSIFLTCCSNWSIDSIAAGTAVAEGELIVNAGNAGNDDNTAISLTSLLAAWYNQL